MLEHYRALINIGCSKFVKLFICLSHLPFCSPLYPDLEALQPFRSLCVHVYESCLKYFIIANLPWPQHLNCSLFPRHPSLCIKPYSSTAPPSSLHSSSKSSSKLSPTTPSQTTPSPYTQSTTTPSPTKPSKPAPTTAQDIDSRFIFFVVNFLPKLFYSMTFVFAFICFSVVLPWSVLFSYFCWLRIRGSEQAGAREDIPLREILGPLPPVPEQ